MRERDRVAAFEWHLECYERIDCATSARLTQRHVNQCSVAIGNRQLHGRRLFKYEDGESFYTVSDTHQHCHKCH
jgi:hypothetical protein